MVYKGDFGIELRLDTEVELNNTIEAKILYQKPSGEVGEWTAYVDGTDVVHTVQESELDEAGIWVLQALVLGMSLS